MTICAYGRGVSRNVRLCYELESRLFTITSGGIGRIIFHITLAPEVIS